MGNHLLTKRSTQEKLNSMDLEIFQVVPTVITSAYTAGRILFDATEIENVTMIDGGTAYLHSVTALDKDNDSFSFDLHFWQNEVATEAANTAADLSGSEALAGNFFGAVSLASWEDLGSVNYSQQVSCGLAVKSASSSRSIWITGLLTGAGTPNFNADSDLVLNIAFIRD